MLKIARLATAHMFDGNNQEDPDYELWKNIAEYMDGENAYVVKSTDAKEEYIFIGLCDKRKDKELAYMMEQDSVIGAFIGDREGFETVWKSGEYECDGYFYIESKWIESIKSLREVGELCQTKRT